MPSQPALAEVLGRKRPGDLAVRPVTPRSDADTSSPRRLPACATRVHVSDFRSVTKSPRTVSVSTRALALRVSISKECGQPRINPK